MAYGTGGMRDFIEGLKAHKQGLKTKGTHVKKAKVVHTKIVHGRPVKLSKGYKQTIYRGK
jgi:hypothetical protein